MYSYLAKCLEGIGRVVAQHKSIRDRLHTRDGMWFGSQLATAMLYRLWLLGKFMYHRQSCLAASSRLTAKRFGFTLIELMVAVAVMAILVAAAAPSFVSIFNGNRLTAISNELAASLQSARMEALRRGQRIVLCNSADGLACAAAGTAAWTGWLVFADANSNGTREAAETILRWDPIRAPLQLRASPAISGGNSRVVFRPDGLAYSNGGLLLQANLSPCIVTTTPGENIRDIGITFGSRVAVSRRNGAGTCVAPTNP